MSYLLIVKELTIETRDDPNERMVLLWLLCFVLFIFLLFAYCTFVH